MAKATKDKEDVQKVEVVDSGVDGTEHETQAEAVEARGPRYNDRQTQDEEAEKDELGFRIKGGRLIRRGAERAASAEEVKLWEKLMGDEEDDAAPDLSGVDFASEEAEDLATKEGLSAETFSGENATGKGGFTVGDVAEIVGRTQSSSSDSEVTKS